MENLINYERYTFEILMVTKLNKVMFQIINWFKPNFSVLWHRRQVSISSVKMNISNYKDRNDQDR